MVDNVSWSIPSVGMARDRFQLVDDIAATFEVERDDLLVVSLSMRLCCLLIDRQRASSKGLFCGGILCLKLRNGAIVSGDENQVRYSYSCEEVTSLRFASPQ